ncbi:HAD-IIB family hydrolase [Bifidobacterium magnum]|uniref:phosphomannomutase n=1 Tax=Bifidobacterium magnum TaxID=1692 RepID=A0A087BCI6_9BIFI|nr:HAD-IIB family hydrolase [Bifidobacterium magnum]KFI68736.1 Phosphomannomutase [Bifidobacterium magnum]
MAGIEVPYWDHVNIAGVCAHMKLVAFDLDGTLARSKKPMKPAMAQQLSELSSHIPLAIVSGGKMDLVQSQVIDVLTPEADRDTMHIMPTSGTRYYRWNHGGWEEQYEYSLSPEDRDTVVASLELHAREQGIWYEQTWGDRIEDRGSQITFSALGQQAPVDVKEQWDPDNRKKNALAEVVQADVPHLQVRSGGSTSVDISLRGFDKAYAVRELAKLLGIEVRDIVFIGDRMDPDGNDYPAAKAGTTALRVRGPEDTLELCKAMNAWFDA